MEQLLYDKMKQNITYEAKHIGFRYEKSQVLSDVSFRIQKGERVAILGANGSGKSTLLKIFDALLYPSHGELYFEDSLLNEKYFENEEREFAFRRKVGFVFQDPDVQLFNQTVWDEVLFGPLHLGLPESEVVDRANWAMDTLAISRLRDRSPFTLSGGEKKRVALASILSIKPSVWLFDEPFAGLDPRSQSNLLDFMINTHNRGETIIVSTHDIMLLNELADRVLVISEDHELVADTTPEKLLKQKDFMIQHNLMHTHMHTHGKKVHSHEHIHK